MKKMLSFIVIVCVLTSCANGNENSTSSDSATTSDTTKSISPPPTADTTSTMAPMMGDTSKTDTDSLKR